MSTEPQDTRDSEPLLVSIMRRNPTGDLRYIPGGKRGDTGTSAAGFLRELDRYIADAEQAAERRHRDLVSRLGFGDGITEAMADNDTIVKWFGERGQEADEWIESQLWQNDCALAGHSEEEDCPEHDPILAAERRGAVKALRSAGALLRFNEAYGAANIVFNRGHDIENGADL